MERAVETPAASGRRPGMEKERRNRPGLPSRARRKLREGTHRAAMLDRKIDAIINRPVESEYKAGRVPADALVLRPIERHFRDGGQRAGFAAASSPTPARASLSGAFGVSPL